MNILIVNIESDIFVNKFSLCENTKINAVYRICLMTLSDIQIVLKKKKHVVRDRNI